MAECLTSEVFGRVAFDFVVGKRSLESRGESTVERPQGELSHSC